MHSALPLFRPALRAPHSALRTPHSASALRPPRSALRTPHSALLSPFLCSLRLRGQRMFILRSLVLSFAASLLCGLPIVSVQASGEAVTREWSRYPAVLRLTTHEDIYAVGDVHGEYERLAGLLATNHLIAAAPPEPDRVHGRPDMPSSSAPVT